jgi:hypothetical protein
MTKGKAVERRLIVVSKRRQPTDDGLARLVAAMVLHRLNQIEQRDEAVTDAPREDSA